jgi:thioredoxin-like negative regulator of GroEL
MERVIVIYLTRQGCKTCEIVKPQASLITKKYGALFWEHDEKAQSLLCRLFNIRLYPAVLIFKNGWPVGCFQCHDLVEFKQRLEKTLSEVV